MRFKTLIISLTMLVGVNTTPPNTFNLVEATLPPPSTYDYGYFMIEDAPYIEYWYIHDNINSTYTRPMYSRVEATEHYNYTIYQTLGGLTNRWYLEDNLQVRMIFNRSDTNWAYSGGLYTPTKTGSTSYEYIGNTDTSASVPYKVFLTFYNYTDRDFMAFIDLGDNPLNSHFAFSYKGLGWSFYTTDIIGHRIIIPAGTTIDIYNATSTNAINLTAWYLRDLGSSATYQSGYNDGFDEGYQTGTSDGYNSGVNTGYNSGYSQGHEDGYSEGASDLTSAYSDGYISGYSDGLDADAYQEGYTDGSTSGFLGNFHLWIVPAIIVILVLGGVLTIIAKKRREG